MKNKKASHVGLVLSFSMFIIFLIFVYFIVSASIVREDTKKYALDQLNEKILNEFKEEILVLRVYNETTECVNITLPTSGKNAIVFNSEGEIVNSSLSGTTLSFNGTSGFAKIYYSETLENPTIFNLPICNKTIEQKSKILESKIIEPKIISLIEEVSSNYDSLKARLDVPSSYEFDVSFEYENSTIVERGKRDLNLEIYSQETKLFYLSSQGLNQKGILRIKIW